MRRLLLGLLVLILGSQLPPAAARAARPSHLPAALSSTQLDAAVPVPAPSVGTLATGPKPPRTPSKPIRIPHFGELPIAFVPNQGQSHAAVRFQAHALRGTAFFAR